MAELTETSRAGRIHISFFGRRNAGKSSLVNAITGQEISIVSNVKGTTTDPVHKAMEILPLGPVEIIDTPGIDDEGLLGEMRIKKTKQILTKTDVAILVVDATLGMTKVDNDLVDEFKKSDINYIIAYTKSDLLKTKPNLNDNEILVSSINNENIFELKEKIGKLNIKSGVDISLTKNFVKKDDVVVLVMPQDGSAPKGRIILPQVQMIRDLLDNNTVIVATQLTELDTALKKLNNKPDLIITDSQVFKEVEKIIPKDAVLTSFSILLAEFNGLLHDAVLGVSHVDSLKPNDRVLIVEGCTHHRQCEDIGTVKIPNLLKKKLGFDVSFDTNSGANLRENLDDYKMIIHCGACMLTNKEVKYRINIAKEKNIPITNYGILIAYLNGILKRSLQLFPELEKLIK